MPIVQSEKYASYYPNISGDERMLDFSMQTAEEISRTIRALHPFLPCYISCKDKFFIVNPYKFTVLRDEYDVLSGSIIAKNSENTSLTFSLQGQEGYSFFRFNLI